MDLPKTTYALIGVMVSILIIATVAVPVVTNPMGEPPREYSNIAEGTTPQYWADNLDGVTSFKMTVSGYKNVTYTIDGTSYTKEMLNTNGYPFFVSSEYIVTYGTESKFYITHPGDILNTSSNSYASFELKNENGVWKVRLGSNPWTTSNMTWLAYPNDNGDLVKFSMSYVDTTVFFVESLDDFIGVSGATTTQAAVTYESGQTIPSGVRLTIDSEEVADGYEVSGVKFIRDGSQSNESFLLLLVPAVVIVGEQSTHSDLLGAILLVLFIVPVMMAVQIIAGRRD